MNVEIFNCLIVVINNTHTHTTHPKPDYNFRGKFLISKYFKAVRSVQLFSLILEQSCTAFINYMQIKTGYEISLKNIHSGVS